MLSLYQLQMSTDLRPIPSPRRLTLPTTEQHPPLRCPWKVTTEHYHILSRELASVASAVPPSLALSSRHTLSCYLEGYFRGSYSHLPYLHTQSLSPTTHVAKAVVNRCGRGISSGGGSSHTPKDQPSAITGGISWTKRSAAIAKPARSSGISFVVRPHSQDGLSMASQAAMLVRQFGISSHERKAPKDITWEQWIDCEGRRRSLFTAYALFNLQTVAFNVPPMALNHKVHLQLPASATEWEAPNTEALLAARSWGIPGEQSVTQELDQLLSGRPIETTMSSLGNYLLIHGLFQHIFFARLASSCLANTATSLPPDFVNNMEAALRSWQKSWEATGESTLNPSSPKSPLGFNPTALLRLAYIRLNANTGPTRHLLSREPTKIADVFVDASARSVRSVLCNRSAHLDRAILQFIHALSVPVQVGIAFVARTQTLTWSFQQPLCNLECAFLVHWLLALDSTSKRRGRQGLAASRGAQAAKCWSVWFQVSELGDGVQDTPDYVTRLRHLAATTTRMWAEVYGGFQVYEMAYTIGARLSIITNTLSGLEV
ncbi:hypothetical protein BDW59DRAFT_166754 [Aspergillus cavernicola]|uniref:Transcription factor domain-containing protein n=1 Tax=Aspergillus cavernicola TaxID=176166 RepID=A0ABR4HLI4_9EURO